MEEKGLVHRKGEGMKCSVRVSKTFNLEAASTAESAEALELRLLD